MSGVDSVEAVVIVVVASSKPCWVQLTDFWSFLETSCAREEGLNIGVDRCCFALEDEEEAVRSADLFLLAFGMKFDLRSQISWNFPSVPRGEIFSIFYSLYNILVEDKSSIWLPLLFTRFEVAT